MATSSIPRHLTDRDEEILLALDRCPLTVVQLLKLSSRSRASRSPASAASRTAFRSYARPAGSSWPYATASRGRSPDYYRLTLLGFRLLHGEHALPPAKRHFSEVSVGAPSPYPLPRRLRRPYARRRPPTRHPPQEFLPREHAPAARRRRGPLSRFRLRTPHARRPAVQLPRRTRQRHRAGSIGQGHRSWQRKIRRYNVLQDRNYPDRFRVLVVCTRCSGPLHSILTWPPSTPRIRSGASSTASTFPTTWPNPTPSATPASATTAQLASPSYRNLPPPGHRPFHAPVPQRNSLQHAARAGKSLLPLPGGLVPTARIATAHPPLSVIVSPREQRFVGVGDEPRPAPVEFGPDVRPLPGLGPRLAIKAPATPAVRNQAHPPGGRVLSRRTSIRAVVRATSNKNFPDAALARPLRHAAARVRALLPSRHAPLPQRAGRQRRGARSTWNRSSPRSTRPILAGIPIDLHLRLAREDRPPLLPRSPAT